MAVHGTILARERRIRGGANAVCNGASWSSAIHNRASHTSTIRNGTTYNGAIHNSANRVNTNATRVIPPTAFSRHPLRCRWWPNLD